MKYKSNKNLLANLMDFSIYLLLKKFTKKIFIYNFKIKKIEIYKLK